MTELDPDVADDVPWSDSVTPYDEQHFVTYLRLLDADDEGADWREVARVVLHRNPAAEPDRTRRCWEAHLKRAKWMTESGYRQLLLDARDTPCPKPRWTALRRGLDAKGDVLARACPRVTA